MDMATYNSKHWGYETSIHETKSVHTQQITRKSHSILSDKSISRKQYIYVLKTQSCAQVLISNYVEYFFFQLRYQTKGEGLVTFVELTMCKSLLQLFSWLLPWVQLFLCLVKTTWRTALLHIEILLIVFTALGVGSF